MPLVYVLLEAVMNKWFGESEGGMQLVCFFHVSSERRSCEQ